jgi:hypothetical protein
MIRYRLQCADDHAFDAWFANSAAFDEQAARGLVSCAVCGSVKVTKALMAPSVGKKGNRKADAGRPAAREPAADDAPVAAVNADAARLTAPETAAQLQLLALMRKVRAEVVAKAENVGRDFAEEARKIHYDEAPARGIYGEASKSEVAALQEEGITVYPLPDVPDDRN